MTSAEAGLLLLQPTHDIPTAPDRAHGTEESEGLTAQVFAFRVWMEPNGLLTSDDPGGLHAAPLLGEAGTLAAGYQIRRLGLLRSYSSWAVEAILYALLAIVAFSLILLTALHRSISGWERSSCLLRLIPGCRLSMSGRGT